MTRFCLLAPSYFRFLRKCSSEFDGKIHEAILLIKKHNPQLNKQLYGRGAFILLKVL